MPGIGSKRRREGGGVQDGWREGARAAGQGEGAGGPVTI